MPLAQLATTQVALGAVDRLVRRGLLMMSCFTPTDAAHILNRFDAFDRQAAMYGGTLLARQKSATGSLIAHSPEELAEMVLATLTRQSAIGLMDAALAEDGKGERAVSSSPLLTGLFDESPHTRQTVTSHSLRLDVPLIALGASAATHYPDIAACLGATLIVPDHADVAGAVGAAAGAVRQRVSIIVTQPTDGVFRVHHPDGVNDFPTRDEALQQAEDGARLLAETRAHAAGACCPNITCEKQISEVEIGGGATLFMEAIITAEAMGAPSPKAQR
jgi:N-methylhydantoinase A/oxoprolinase/acetone carboxylase beta subunit